jgi:hypothetical protein
MSRNHACRGWRDAALLVQPQASLAFHQLGHSSLEEQVHGFRELLRRPQYVAGGARPLGRLTLPFETGVLAHQAEDLERTRQQAWHHFHHFHADHNADLQHCKTCIKVLHVSFAITGDIVGHCSVSGGWQRCIC